MDRLDLLALLTRIAETGSLSAAARALGLSQPTASRQLRALEDRLGAELVRRSTHDLSLTDAGLRALAEARTMTAQWEALGEAVRGDGGRLSGPLTVLAPAGLGQTVLADIAARFLREHPGVTMDWRIDDRPRDLVAEGIDLWIRIGPVQDEGLVVRPLALIERIVVAAPGTLAATPEALAGHPAVVLSPYASAELTLTGPGGTQVTVQLRVAARTEQIFAADRLVRSGVGLGLLPRWLVADGLASGALVELYPGWRGPEIALSLAWTPSRHRPARARRFAEHLQAAPELAALNTTELLTDRPTSAS
ncbi:MAG: LysR family transcriptional regulator [Pseudomonadota bacterium]